MVGFVASAGGELQVPPPYEFGGIWSAHFVLEGTRDKLQKICDDTINVCKDAGFRYDVSDRNVTLEVLDYSTMIAKDSGWGSASQREVLFSIHVVKKSLSGVPIPEHDQHARFVPYIFVDNFSSAVAGREVLGMPKVLAEIQSPGESNRGYPFWARTDAFVRKRDSAITRNALFLWIGNASDRPDARRGAVASVAPAIGPLMTPRLPKFEKVKTKPRPERGANSPKSGFESFPYPWGYIDLSGVPPKEKKAVRKALSDSGAPAGQVGTQPVAAPRFRVIQFKQFRDAQHSKQACYQAVQQSWYHVPNVTRESLPNASVWITHHDSLPIAKELGLVPLPGAPKAAPGRPTSYQVRAPATLFYLESMSLYDVKTICVVEPPPAGSTSRHRAAARATE